MRKKYFIPLSMFALILIIILALVFIDKMLFAMKRSSFSTVRSIQVALDQECYIDSIEETTLHEIIGQISEHQQFLTDEQYDYVITELSKIYGIDVSKSRDVSKPLLDLWGNRFQIKCKSKEKIYKFIVLSKGPDGIYGTKDDICSVDE